MRTIAITGASGVVGKQLLDCLRNRADISVRVLVHINRDNDRFNSHNVVPIEGDLLRPETLSSLLEPGCSVVNLAYLASKSKHDNLLAVSNLANACARMKIRRLVHCSTAVVVGRAPEDEITEESQCDPRNDYEAIKLDIEKCLLDTSRNNFELAILRPTAVFGPDGKNLLKLANRIRFSKGVSDYLRSCLYSGRRLNLVYVDNVTSAIMFLMEADIRGVNTFIIANDESPMNNYRDVEKFLMKALHSKDYMLPIVPLPNLLLSILLKLVGRSNTNPRRVYNDRRLVEAGFKKPVSFEEGLELFADWYNIEYRLAR